MAEHGRVPRPAGEVCPRPPYLVELLDSPPKSPAPGSIRAPRPRQGAGAVTPQTARIARPSPLGPLAGIPRAIRRKPTRTMARQAPRRKAQRLGHLTETGPVTRQGAPYLQTTALVILKPRTPAIGTLIPAKHTRIAPVRKRKSP